jgi:hypothetical protein
VTWLNAAQLHARPEDLDSRIPIGSVHARLKARAGDHASAESAVGESLGLAEQTDALNLRAQALVAAAEVFAAGHRDEEATEALAEARALYAEKENAAAATLLRMAATAS